MSDKRFKLSDRQIRQIREERSQGVPLAKLVKKYKVGIAYLSEVCRGKCRVDAGGPISTNTNYTLTDKQVIEIRRKRYKGEKSRDLALEYNVKPKQISLICTGKSRVSVRGVITNAKELLFTKQQVKAIRNRRFNGERVGDLALEYGVSSNAISNMVTGKTYGNYPGPIVEGHCIPPNVIILMRKKHRKGATCEQLAEEGSSSLLK